ncbi:hypothetical protein PhCBS80983_g01424 [Powellomyces hirtus]|uniref:DNA helicase n=1 Tax=Powellomyces hirtus TaxID=109895 RepID=A0A507EAT2_9FUNG|nr:hypothetical protein PhCBS80983_g01424 [Powellomyces hirtus]
MTVPLTDPDRRIVRISSLVASSTLTPTVSEKTFVALLLLHLGLDMTTHAANHNEEITSAAVTKGTTGTGDSGRAKAPPTAIKKITERRSDKVGEADALEERANDPKIREPTSSIKGRKDKLMAFDSSHDVQPAGAKPYVSNFEAVMISKVHDQIAVTSTANPTKNSTGSNTRDPIKAMSKSKADTRTDNFDDEADFTPNEPGSSEESPEEDEEPESSEDDKEPSRLRRRKGATVMISEDESESDEEAGPTNGHHQPLCTRCGRPSHNKKRKKREDDDLEEDLGQLIQCSRTYFESQWKCVDCTIWNDHVELILTFRDSAETTEGDTSREFYVKFAGWSYRHCTWVSERWLSGVRKEKAKYRNFLRMVAEENQAALDAGDGLIWPKEVDDVVPSDLVTVGGVLDVSYHDVHGTETIENVKQFYIKWVGLPHNKCNWEDCFEADDPMYETLVQKYEEFLRRNMLGDPSEKPAESRFFREYTEQPKFIGGGKLKPYQLDGLNWLMYKWSKHMPSILADDMGLGKTVQIVALLASLHHDYHLSPFLIAAPSSTLGHWEAELAAWAPELVVVRYAGDAQTREVIRSHEIFGPSDSSRTQSKNVRFHVLLVHYETLARDCAFFKKIKFDVMICDEGHRLKNDSAATFEAFRKHLKVEHRIILTGTPLQNNVRELFNLLSFLDPVKFAKPQDWEAKYGGDLITDEMVKEIHVLLKPYFLRRTKENADLDLPPKVEILVPLSLSPLQTELYKAIISKSAALLKQIGVSTTGKEDARVSYLKNILMELRKVCNHPYSLQDVEPTGLSDEESHKRLIGASGKLTLLHKMLPKLKSGGHRILIFSQFKLTLDILEDYLNVENYGYCRMDGDTTITDRQPIINRFNSPESDAFVFLLTTRTGAEGINLTAADTIILFDADWNPHRDIQAMARAHRIGQTKPLVVYRFFNRRCVEEKILEVGKKKLVLDHLLIEQMGSNADSRENLSSIIKYGAKALFEENEESLDAARIKYDNAEVDKLLDRSVIFQKKTDEESGPSAATDKLGAFAKLWQTDKAELVEQELTDIAGDASDMPEDEGDQGAFWDNLLKHTAEDAMQREAIEYDEHGRAKRRRKNVNYSELQRARVKMQSRDPSDAEEEEVDIQPRVTEDPEFEPELEEAENGDDGDTEDDNVEEPGEEVLMDISVVPKKGPGRPRKSITDLPGNQGKKRKINQSSAGVNGQQIFPTTATSQALPGGGVRTIYHKPLPNTQPNLPTRAHPINPLQNPTSKGKRNAPALVVPPSVIPPPSAAMRSAAEILVRAYTTPNKAPACWLCFSTNLHLIGDCPMRTSAAYILDAYFQMDAAVKVVSLADDVRYELIMKMKILSQFLKQIKGAGTVTGISNLVVPPSPAPLPTVMPVPHTMVAAELARPNPTLKEMIAQRQQGASGKKWPILPPAVSQGTGSGSSGIPPSVPTATQPLKVAVTTASTLTAPQANGKISNSSAAGIRSGSASSPNVQNVASVSPVTSVAPSGGLLNSSVPAGPVSERPSANISRYARQQALSQNIVPAIQSTVAGPPISHSINPPPNTAAQPKYQSSFGLTSQLQANTPHPTTTSSMPAGPPSVTSIPSASSTSIASSARQMVVRPAEAVMSHQPSPPSHTPVQPTSLVPTEAQFSVNKSVASERVPAGNCLFCASPEHPTDSFTCPLLRANPVAYRRRLIELIRTGLISHLTLQKVQEMEQRAVFYLQNNVKPPDASGTRSTSASSATSNSAVFSSGAPVAWPVSTAASQHDLNVGHGLTPTSSVFQALPQPMQGLSSTWPYTPQHHWNGQQPISNFVQQTFIPLQNPTTFQQQQSAPWIAPQGQYGPPPQPAFPQQMQFQQWHPQMNIPMSYPPPAWPNVTNAPPYQQLYQMQQPQQPIRPNLSPGTIVDLTEESENGKV